MIEVCSMNKVLYKAGRILLLMFKEYVNDSNVKLLRDVFSIKINI